MSLDYPAPVQDAIAVSYKIDAGLGSSVESLIAMFWGDPGRVEQVAGEWKDGARFAAESIAGLREELRSVVDERFWEGPAKDSYQRWIEQLIDQTLAPVRSGLERVNTTLLGAADTIGDMRRSLVRLCASFVGTVAGLFGGPAGWAAALIVGTWFIAELLDFHDSYINALDSQAAEMRGIRDKAVG